MRKAALLYIVYGVLCAYRLVAQEASSGFGLRATVSGQVAGSTEFTEAPRSGSALAPGFRGVVYPTWKIDDHWTVTGALQLYTRPYFFAEFSTKGYGVKGNILQGSVNYARVSNKGSILVRAGQLSTAFGSFPLRYDDADNALIDVPIEYGYYSALVTNLGLAGAQIDGTRGKWDARAQFANSSPANPRSLFAHDQYGNWAGGAGYTIRQGLRVGVSGYRGPYLDRKDPDFHPGELKPSSLPGHAVGLDVAWAHGHWNLQGELHQFVLPYTLIPTERYHAGYVEAKRVLNARWYLAARGGYISSNADGKQQSFEGTAGFRPNRLQVIKVGYELGHKSVGPDPFENTVAMQIVTSFHLAASRN